MDSKTIYASQTKNLAKLLDTRADSPTVYHGADLAVILKHQLNAPLAEELSSPICGAEGRTDPLTNLDESLKTFADLFHHKNPPLDLLRRAKDFAKTCRAHADLLPPEVATLLYYTAIIVARIRHQQKITETDDAGLKKGLTWAVGLAWVDEATKNLLRQGIAELK